MAVAEASKLTATTAASGGAASGTTFLRQVPITDRLASFVLSKPLENLLVLGEKAAVPAVRVEDLPIRGHFEDAVVPLCQLHCDAEFGPDGGRQPGGQTVEASFDAIDYLDPPVLRYAALIAHGTSF